MTDWAVVLVTVGVKQKSKAEKWQKLLLQAKQKKPHYAQSGQWPKSMRNGQRKEASDGEQQQLVNGRYVTYRKFFPLDRRGSMVGMGFAHVKRMCPPEG